MHNQSLIIDGVRVPCFLYKVSNGPVVGDSGKRARSSRRNRANILLG